MKKGPEAVLPALRNSRGVQKTPTTTAPKNKNTKAMVISCNSRAKATSLSESFKSLGWGPACVKPATPKNENCSFISACYTKSANA